MLERDIDGNNFNFKMQVSYERKIEINYSEISSFIKHNNNSKQIVFIDPIVLANQEIFLEAESSNPNICLVPTNLHETNKDLDSLKSILEVLESHGIGRKGDLILAVGGGALLDTVAFAASIFRRGISVVKIPTTLLAIVDASIGIKTGINYLGQRNRIGSYHFDYKVIIDPSLLKGLHHNLMRQGLGEIFKIAIIKSRYLFDYLIRNLDQLEETEFYNTPEGLYILKESIFLMLEELHDNPREDNLLRCVDFGHSFSPLVEMESIKSSVCKSLPHGFSVAFDCLLTSTISFKRNLLTEIDYKQIFSLFSKFDFDFSNDIYKDLNLLWASYLEMTKHRGGNQNQPIPTSIGKHTFIQDLTFDELSLSSAYLQELLKK